MTISNPRNESLQQLLPLIQQRFPQASIRKVLLTPEAIFIPNGNFKFVLRKKNSGLKVDHTLPPLYIIGAIIVSVILVSVVMSLIYGQLMLGIGGALWVILGVLVMKYLFQSIKKTDFETFRDNITSAIAGFNFEKQNPTVGI